MKNNSLFNKINLFYKLATLDPKVQKLVTNIQYAINLELVAGTRVLNAAIQKNPKSQGLRSLKAIFTDISNANRELISNPDSVLERIINKINDANFFSSKSNAGTGYDPATTINGRVSPVGYLTRIKNHAENLLKYLPKEKAVSNKNFPMS